MGSGHVTLPRGLEVVMESRASNNPIMIPNTPKPPTTPTVIQCVAHALPAMAFFFLFLFAPLFVAFLLTVYIALCKPGYAVSAADTSSV